ncbi:hypothetical protein ACIHFD_49825 [Nonomuraea sp. NPDC051941]|uniref:hypothetical protein n=1 Tax=Nonomuraea sp. NPDC051941 TaxID=3364373 RepID=UPI0037C5E71C
MFVLIAELHNGDEPQGAVPFGPYDDAPTNDDIETVYRWAAARGYDRDRHEVTVEPHRLTDPAEPFTPGRFAAVPVEPGSKDALRALT